MSTFEQTADSHETSARPPSEMPWPPSENQGPNPLVQLILARLIEFWRKPEAIFWVYGFPLMMAVGLGIAFRNRPAPVTTVDIQNTPVAGVIADALRATEAPAKSTVASADPRSSASAPERPRFEVHLVDADEGRKRLRRAKTQILIVPQAESAEQATSLARTRFNYVYDPTRPESVLARRIVDDVLQRAAGRKDPIAVGESLVSEPGGRYIDFLIPGLMGASLLGGGLWGIGFVTVDMRVRNLLKRFITTPMKKSDFLLGMMISRFLFMVTEVLLLLAFSWLVFGVGIAGSPALVFALVVLGAVTFAGVGLLVASRAKTLETASGLMNLVMLPMWMLSGIFFSPDRFPAVVQPLIQLLPLTPLIAALREVMIEGTGLVGVLPEIGILVAWSIVSFALALRLFRWF